MVRQCAGMWDFSAAHRADLISGDRDDGSRSAGQGHKLDFISRVVWIDVDDGSNVTGFEAIVGQRRGQNDSVVFANHAGKLLQWIGRDQPWHAGSDVDDPDGPDGRRAPVRTLKRTVDPILGAMLGLGHGGNGMLAGVGNQSVRQYLPILRSESKSPEEICFAAAFRMVRSEQVFNDFAALNQGMGRVGQVHWSSCKHVYGPKPAAKRSQRFSAFSYTLFNSASLISFSGAGCPLQISNAFAP